MKIAVFHQHYLMPGQGGGSRFNEMARHWTDAGHSVLVVAGSVNCGFNAPRNSLFRREKDGTVDVWRCYVPGTYSKNYLGRSWALLGYMISASIAALFIPRPDVIIATAPPLVAVVPGWIAARFRRRNVPWIFEIRDLWPESAVTTGVLREKSPITRLLYLLERWACRSADCINVLTPAFRENLLRRTLASDEKIVFVPNGADLDTFHPRRRENSVRREFGWGGRRVVLYAGAHGRANALRQLIDAAEHLKGRPDILIACLGDGPERARLERDARARGLGNIQFHGPQPKERMPEFINACDIGIAVLQNNPTFRTVYPNKIFDYMACERPVLLGIDGVARQLVCDQARAGSFAEPENGAAIARAIEKMLADPAACERMGANGRAWVLENAARSGLAHRYLKVMMRLTNGAARASAAG